MTIRVCFVCLGNICRSPTAEATMRKLVEDEALADTIVLDSAGTGGWHVGEPPDRRAKAAGARRGIDLQGRARQFTARDFSSFDYIVAMDRSNRDDLLALAPDEPSRAKVVLFRDFDPGGSRGADVPDPYYGGADGFERVLEICEASSRGFLEHLRERHL